MSALKKTKTAPITKPIKIDADLRRKFRDLLSKGKEGVITYAHKTKKKKTTPRKKSVAPRKKTTSPRKKTSTTHVPKKRTTHKRRAPKRKLTYSEVRTAHTKLELKRIRYIKFTPVEGSEALWQQKVMIGGEEKTYTIFSKYVIFKKYTLYAHILFTNGTLRCLGDETAAYDHTTVCSEIANRRKIVGIGFEEHLETVGTKVRGRPIHELALKALGADLFAQLMEEMHTDRDWSAKESKKEEA